MQGLTVLQRCMTTNLMILLSQCSEVVHTDRLKQMDMLLPPNIQPSIPLNPLLLPYLALGPLPFSRRWGRPGISLNLFNFHSFFFLCKTTTACSLCICVMLYLPEYFLNHYLLLFILIDSNSIPALPLFLECHFRWLLPLVGIRHPLFSTVNAPNKRHFAELAFPWATHYSNGIQSLIYTLCTFCHVDTHTSGLQMFLENTTVRWGCKLQLAGCLIGWLVY